MHLRRIAAVPLVAFDRAGEPPARVGGRGEERAAKLGLGAAKGDPLEALAVVSRRDAADVALANDAGLEQPHRTGGDPRARPTGAVRTGDIERVAQPTRYASRSKQCVEQQRLLAARFV